MSVDYKSMDHRQAEQDFNRARNRAVLSKIRHFLYPDRDNLLSFNDVKKILKPRNEIYMGMQVVPIKKIIGSEGRYRDFNKYFLPRKEFLRARWQRVDLANIRDIPLPAIRLYEIGGVYFVRDGNHRVSVARSQGQEHIDAEVISLASEITITTSMTVDTLLDAVVEYEKKLFYEKTRFLELTGDSTLNFTQPGCYDVIYNHILVHKYYINEDQEDEIPFEQALISWYDNVYSPIINILKENMLRIDFHRRYPGDLYVWIVKHWEYLKDENGVSFSLADAARDFASKHSKDKNICLRYIAALLKRMTKNRRQKMAANHHA